MTDRELVIQQREQLASQEKHIVFLEDTISRLSQNIEQLIAEINELKEKLNKNSGNSSKPPSSDGLNRPKPKSLRQKSGKKPGGQRGHKGTNLEVPEHVDKVVEHFPEECIRCPNLDKCKGKICHKKESRYVTDIKIEKEVTEHTVYQAEECPLHKHALRGAFPAGVNATVQYGTTVKTFVVNENIVNGTGADKIARTANNLIGLKISTGTVMNIIGDISSRMDAPLNVIKDNLKKSPVNNYDETGVNVDGKISWCHSASNRLFTLLTLSESRGEDGMKENGVIGKQPGVAVHDCWRPYWKFSNVVHAVCCAHLLRELNGIIENHPEQEWAPEFKKMLEELHRLKVTYDSFGRPMESCYRNYYGHLYDTIIGKAWKENPLAENTERKKGRPKKTTAQNLIERLERLKESVLLFTTSPDIPFSNNGAEQSVRNLKVKTKIAGCFRSKAGAECYLRIQSYIDSARKHGVNACEAIRLAFLGTPNLCLGC